jgi:Tfp pilus tip-associated adhesin PilY1
MKPYCGRLGTTTVFTLSGSSQASAAFGAQTYCIRVATGDQPAHIDIGDGTPTATTSDPIMPKDSVDYFTVTPGQKIAVLQAGTAGSLSVTEMA